MVDETITVGSIEEPVEDSEEEIPVKSKKKGGFALLMDDGGDSLPSDQSEEEEIRIEMMFGHDCKEEKKMEKV